MIKMWTKLSVLNFRWHLAIATLIRMLCICYGNYHDKHFKVPYTDVDYKVFTDAARLILENGSPYERHTYRYSPLIAILLVPNLLLHSAFGKVLFSLADLLVALLIRSIVQHMLQEYNSFEASTNQLGDSTEGKKQKLKAIRSRSRKIKYDKAIKDERCIKSELAAMLWLYNPLTIAIATRGNSDSIAGLLVLLTLYYLQCKKKYFISGLIHGVSVHFRLYPIIYSLALFMYASKYSYYATNRSKTVPAKQCKEKKEIKSAQNQSQSQVLKEKSTMKHEVALQSDNVLDYERKTIFKKVYIMHLIPNMDQLRLIVGCLISLSVLTGLFYYLYGYKFLFETYIYHLVRQDTRHNFSLFFYLQYLTAGVKNIGIWQKVLISLPQLVLLLVFSIRYGLNKVSLNFAILTLTIVMVAYNTVLTSQYFIWILVILPLCVWQIKMSCRMGTFLLIIWLAAQGAWLLPAYFLEFHGQNTFLFIWLQSVSFFCANIAILGRLIMNYMPIKRLKTI